MQANVCGLAQVIRITGMGLLLYRRVRMCLVMEWQEADALRLVGNYVEPGRVDIA